MSHPYYHGPPSDHFDGTRFFHPGLPNADKSIRELLRWQVLGHKSRWPATVPGVSGLRPPQRVCDLRVTCIGHSSLLIQVANLNLLIDPVWAERASPLRWTGPRRHNPPAIALEDLPPIDVVLITHNHYDHLDTATLERLWRDHRPRVITPLGNDTIIRASVPDIGVGTGDWWDRFTVSGDVGITIVPSYHWSSRSLTDRRMALWGGFVLETPSGVVYCAGDTAYRDGKLFREIGARFEPPAIAILPIGAYEPRWFMATQHVNPEEAVQIALDLRARQVLGVHWGTFPLTDEPYDEPEIRFTQAVRSHNLSSSNFLALRPGQVWTPSR